MNPPTRYHREEMDNLVLHFELKRHPCQNYRDLDKLALI
jgi:hypothetical protein